MPADHRKDRCGAERSVKHFRHRASTNGVRPMIGALWPVLVDAMASPEPNGGPAWAAPCGATPSVALAKAGA